MEIINSYPFVLWISDYEYEYHAWNICTTSVTEAVTIIVTPRNNMFEL